MKKAVGLLLLALLVAINPNVGLAKCSDQVTAAVTEASTYFPTTFLDTFDLRCEGDEVEGAKLSDEVVASINDTVYHALNALQNLRHLSVADFDGSPVTEAMLTSGNPVLEQAGRLLKLQIDQVRNIKSIVLSDRRHYILKDPLFKLVPSDDEQAGLTLYVHLLSEDAFGGYQEGNTKQCLAESCSDVPDELYRILATPANKPAPQEAKMPLR